MLKVCKITKKKIIKHKEIIIIIILKEISSKETYKTTIFNHSLGMEFNNKVLKPMINLS